MQTAMDTAASRLPSSLMAIARQLGEPMLPARVEAFPVDPQRRIQVWEFLALSDGRRQVVAVDLRERRLHRWKTCSRPFDK